MMQEVEILKTIQELICSFFPKNSLHYPRKKLALICWADDGMIFLERKTLVLPF